MNGENQPESFASLFDRLPARSTETEEGIGAALKRSPELAWTVFKDGETPFLKALKAGNLEVFNALLGSFEEALRNGTLTKEALTKHLGHEDAGKKTLLYHAVHHYAAGKVDKKMDKMLERLVALAGDDAVSMAGLDEERNTILHLVNDAKSEFFTSALARYLRNHKDAAELVRAENNDGRTPMQGIISPQGVSFFAAIDKAHMERFAGRYGVMEGIMHAMLETRNPSGNNTQECFDTLWALHREAPAAIRAGKKDIRVSQEFFDFMVSLPATDNPEELQKRRELITAYVGNTLSLVTEPTLEGKVFAVGRADAINATLSEARDLVNRTMFTVLKTGDTQLLKMLKPHLDRFKNLPKLYEKQLKEVGVEKQAEDLLYIRLDHDSANALSGGKSGMAEVLKAMLDMGITLEKRMDNSFLKVIIDGARGNDGKIVPEKAANAAAVLRVLREKGVQYFLRNDDGMSLIFRAINRRDVGMVSFLMENHLFLPENPDPLELNQPPLKYARNIYIRNDGNISEQEGAILSMLVAREAKLLLPHILTGVNAAGAPSPGPIPQRPSPHQPMP